MLKYISLQYIDNVLNDNQTGKALVSAKSQLLYIRMLINRFRNDKDARGGFIETSQKINFDTYKYELIELQSIGLIEIKFSNEQYEYIIKPLWEKFIPVFMPDYSNVNNINKYEKDLLSSEQTLEYVMMRERVSKDDAKKLLNFFIIEQKVTDKIYSNLQDAKKHFLAWVRTNNNHILSKVEKNKPNIAKGNSYTD
jgi:hypothetical protein